MIFGIGGRSRASAPIAAAATAAAASDQSRTVFDRVIARSLPAVSSRRTRSRASFTSHGDWSTPASFASRLAGATPASRARTPR